MLVRQNCTRNFSRFWLSLPSLASLLISLAFFSAWSGVALADYIPDFQGAPGAANESSTVLDITTTYYVHVSYDGSGNFAATGGYPQLNDDSDPIYDVGGAINEMDINLTINPTNDALTGGTLLIYGEASSHYTGSSSGYLLEGTISQFGFPNPSQASTGHGDEEFQFIFNTTGGDLAAFYPAIAVDLEHVNVNFSGTFGSTAFDDTSFIATSDTYAVPEPSSLSLLCFGAVVMGYNVLRSARVFSRSLRG
jgi:hypothetical protein